MTDLITIEKLLTVIKSKIDVHLQFKKEYDKQLASDFSLFNFFSMGENKMSQILAFFLDEKQNHGQGNIFLKEFVKLFYHTEIDITSSLNICEKVITNKRRIDIYIELETMIIAIENKIWADDQDNQLKDYAAYLEKSKGNYLLLYLTPYGVHPTAKSIDETLKADLIKQKKLKIISYEQDIIRLINHWLMVCQADNVSYFLKEFKKDIESKLLRKNTFSMAKDLREIIYSNEREITYLVNEYKEIEKEILAKFKKVKKKLDSISPKVSEGIQISQSHFFLWEGRKKIYKYALYKNGNKVWIQLIQEGIAFYFNYYLEKGTDDLFHKILIDLHINDITNIAHGQSANKLAAIYLDKVQIVNTAFNNYDAHH